MTKDWIEFIPKFHQTFLPILNVLSSGEQMHYRELVKQVISDTYSDLPAESLKLKTKSGTNVLADRIGWGKSYLKQAKVIEYPLRGNVKITAKGLEILKLGGWTLKELSKDPDYLAYQDAKNEKRTSQLVELDQDDSPQDAIDRGINLLEREVKLELLDRLKSSDPYFFERVILELLKKMGYGEFSETPKSGDGGIDGIVDQDVLGLDKIYIQAKRFNENKVRETDIRNFIGAMSGDTLKGVFVTTSTFDDKAITKAKEAHHKIVLIDGQQLVDLMYQFSVGVQVKNEYVIKGLDEDFFDE